MTAMNVFATPDAIHIATDGASWLPDGRVVHEGQKVAILAHLPAVIALRGPSILIPSLVANVSANFTEFDGLADAAPVLFRAVHDQYRTEMGKRGIADQTPRDAEFVVAGWSGERGCLEAYGFQSHDRDGRAPWQPFAIESGNCIVAPSDAALVKKARAIDWDVLLSDPESVMLQMMELQRDIPLALDDGRKMSVVGAFCQHTTLTRKSISTRIVKRWACFEDDREGAQP
ncbi:hypothetical protein ASG52_08795 [Methylobacterium sp. Leaf456]|uniref:hypothetical protein n=1 Tax=Methylobacterium sp. Leaf456 TaxID=1736382 RepID=UPI00070003BB|nr:hypothetical protein [Methylobacterium sp. Leaf456]KQT49066.1 hypothetical protein ASG52_08795 [Methylobacterium sp. Leaf456]